MICESCENPFEILAKGSGGKNRRFCYNCMPSGLTKSSRGLLRNKLYKKKSTDHKIKLGCQNCGYNRFAGSLDWHHPMDDKEYNPADTLIRNWNLYLQETSKCILLCSNCHRELHGGFICL